MMIYAALRGDSREQHTKKLMVVDDAAARRCASNFPHNAPRSGLGIGQLQQSQTQVAPKYFRAIGHGVFTDEARDIAFAVAREAAVESVNSFDPEVGTTIEQWRVKLVARALARAANATFGEFVLPPERAAQVRVLRSTEARLYSEFGRFPTD